MKLNIIRKLSILTCTVLIVSLVPIKAFSANIAAGAGWYIDNKNNLHINGYIENTSADTDNTPWKNYKNLITAVYTYPGASVNNCAFLFADCYKMISADVSNLATAGVTDMSYMFFYCGQLSALNMNGLDTSDVTDMREMFAFCISLTDIDLSGFDTEKVQKMHGMFYYCSKITVLDLSGFDTSSVTDMSALFYGCEALTLLDIGGFTTENVTNMSEMFRSCKSLKTLDLSSFNSPDIMNTFAMFCGCTSLSKLDISNIIAKNETDMESMFSGCRNLCGLETNATILHKTAEQLIAVSAEWYNKADVSLVYTDAVALKSINGKVSLIRQGFENNSAILFGNIRSAGGCSSDICVSLISLSDNDVIETLDMNVTQHQYSFGNLGVGEYKVMLSGYGYCTRIYPVFVGEYNVGLNTFINICGDINGNGELDADDYSFAVNTALGSENVVPADTAQDSAYKFAVADIVSDGFIDVLDCTLIERLVNAA